MAGPNFSETERVIHEAEAQSRASHAAVREILIEGGRPDLAADLDANLKDIETGVSQARSVWHSISPTQRRALFRLASGPTSFRRMEGTRYDIVSPVGSMMTSVRLATVRALAARGLLDWTGGAFDPEGSAVLNEYGRFVVAKGQARNK